MTVEPLVCRDCGTGHAAAERFCPACGLPLVLAASEGAPRPVSERHERARKVKRQYSEGALVKVGWARNQAEAELISGLLLEEGIASVARRSGGFDVPDFLAAGPRDILVAQSGEEVARDVLRSAAPVAGEGADAAAVPRAGTPVWIQALAVTMVVVVLATIAAGVVVAVF